MRSQGKVFIYGLVDPRTDEVRYIGKTVNLEERLRVHLTQSRKQKNYNPHKERWIRQLLKRGLEPRIEVIRECETSNWGEVEDQCLKEFKSRGARLTNINKGGKGGSIKGRRLKDEVRRKISKTLKGQPSHRKGKTGIYSKETLERMSKSQVGRKHSEEAKRKISESNRGVSRGKGVPKSKEHVAKVAAANRGRKHSQEMRDALSKIAKSRPNLVEHMKAMRRKSSGTLGYKHTDEAKKKISEARKRFLESQLEAEND